MRGGAMAAVGRYCARTSVRPMTWECGAITDSRVKLSSYSGSSFPRCREFVLPPSSFRVKASEKLSGGVDEQWTRHCSSDPLPFSSAERSTEKSDMVEQVQDNQPFQPSNLGDDAYFTGLSEKEIKRRRKIGVANKGKSPWTKGRKLTKEHKQLIKQRTIEALSDPKVRKKMGHRQLHRQGSKDKISAALRKIWERRIVSVKSRQVIHCIWSNSIAEAAKQGGHMQDKLDWDSYVKIKSRMLSVFLWNKEKERVTKKLKRAVTKIIAKRLQAAERREVQTRRTKKTEPEKLVLQKSDNQPRRVVASTRPKLKERLTKYSPLTEMVSALIHLYHNYLDHFYSPRECPKNWHGRKKELEIVISSRVRKRGGLRKPAAVRRRPVEGRAEVDLVKEPAGRLKELHSPCKDGLPCADT